MSMFRQLVSISTRTRFSNSPVHIPHKYSSLPLQRHLPQSPIPNPHSLQNDGPLATGNFHGSFLGTRNFHGCTFGGKPKTAGSPIFRPPPPRFPSPESRLMQGFEDSCYFKVSIFQFQMGLISPALFPGCQEFRKRGDCMAIPSSDFPINRDL